MEEVLLRFDHIGKKIFGKLENGDLAKCREVERSWQNFIDEEKLPWMRIVVQKYSCKGGKTTLHLAAETGQIEMYKDLSEKYDDKNPKDEEKSTPLHLAASNGHLVICKLIVAEIRDNRNMVL